MSPVGYYVKNSGIFPDPANHVTARDFLMDEVYPTLDSALAQLITTIEENGEFERYVDML